MCASFMYGAILQYNDFVSMADSADPVCNNEFRCMVQTM